MDDNQKFDVQYTTGETSIEWKTFDWTAIFFYLALPFFIRILPLNLIFAIIPFLKPFVVEGVMFLHIAIYVYCGYFVVAVLINKSKLTITPNEVSLKVGPLPLGDNFNLLHSDIAHTYVKSIASVSRRGNVYRSETCSYWVMLKRKQGKELKVYSSINQKEVEEFSGWLDKKINK